MRIVTIKDVARRAGVGVSTVSRVFNDHPDVSAETKEKVLRIAKRLHYRPHSRARQLVTATTETICFVLSNRAVMSPFHSHVLIGVEEHARSLSRNVLFMRFDYSADVAPDDLELPGVIWERGTVDGVILAGTNYPNFVSAVRNLRLPFVLMGNNLVGELPGKDISTVWFDSESGTRLVVEYLIGLGHREIWFVADLGPPWYRVSFESYAATMRHHGLTPNRLEMPPPAGRLLDYGTACAEQLLETCPQATAVMAGDDEIALGVLSGFQRRGIAVPEDISLVGFDDIDEIKYLHPPLTTVRVPKEGVGEHLAQSLFDLINKEQTGPVKRVLPTELVIRSSCAAPRRRDQIRTVVDSIQGNPRTRATDEA